MKKDVNLKLLFLLIFLILCIVLFLSLYDNRIGFLSSDVKNKTIELESITAQAIASDLETKRLQNLNQKLTSDKEDLEKKYSSLTSELTQLKKTTTTLTLELTQIKKDYEQAKSQLQKKEKDFETLQFRFLEVENSLENANDQIGRLSKQLDSVCIKLKGTGTEHEDC